MKNIGGLEALESSDEIMSLIDKFRDFWREVYCGLMEPDKWTKENTNWKEDMGNILKEFFLHEPGLVNLVQIYNSVLLLEEADQLEHNGKDTKDFYWGYGYEAIKSWVDWKNNPDKYK